MSKTSRRDFLKGSVATLVGGQFVAGSKAEAKTFSEADFGVEKKVPLLCRMCAQFCPMIGTVRDGRLVRLDANTSTPYGAICGRGKAAMGALYDPDRIKTPLLRVGKRGEGKFKPISWSEALDLVSKKMLELKNNGEEEALAFLPRFNSAPQLDKAFFKLYGTPNIVGYGDTCFGNGLSISLASLIGGKMSNGVPGQGTSTFSPDYEHAKFGIFMQRNTGGALVAHAWGNMFGRGKKNGLEVLIVDPRRPSELGESEAKWLSIKPGTDAPFLLAIMHEMLEKNYYDKTYMQKYTNADMLIDKETKQPVKTREITITKKGKEHTILDYLVAEESGAFVFKSEAKKPQLEGEYEGIVVDEKTRTCITALSYMKEECKKYTPKWAEDKTTIPAKSIEEVAKKLNDTKPKCFLERGYRSERYASSMREKILINQINLLTGSLGVKGGLFYNRKAKTAGFIKAPKVKKQSISKWYAKHDINSTFMNLGHYRRTWIKAILEDKPYKQKMAFIYGQNIVGGSTGSKEIIDALNKLETIVAVSPFKNETVMYADIVLPDCTFMERDEALRTKYKTPIPTISVNRKAVEPMYDSRDGYWIINQLAKRVLDKDIYEKYFGKFDKEGIMAIWKKQYSHIKGINKEEEASLPPLEDILNGHVWTGKKKYGVKDKGTKTGKLEIYSTYLAKVEADLKDKEYKDFIHASPLPVNIEPFYIQEHPNLATNEFIPITGFSPISSFTGQQTRNNVILREFQEDTNSDAVFINTQKGKSLGLKDGDLIEIFNVKKPEAKTKAKVKLSQCVHPDALFTYYGVGAGYYNTSSMGMRTASHIGFNPNHIADFRFSPLTTGQPAQDFVVSVRRV